MTEIKLFKLLFHSLPKKTKTDIIDKININRGKSKELIVISNIKYIDISLLKTNYNMNLFLKFKDIYFQNVKQLIVYNNEKIYYLFITYSDYKIEIKNKTYIFTINIIGNYDNYKNIDNNLIYNIKINLYQYYFGDKFIFELIDDKMIVENKLNNTVKYNSLGLKNKEGKRGDLIINFILDLNKHCIFNNENKKLLDDIFNIS